jgi:hypothetical protein
VITGNLFYLFMFYSATLSIVQTDYTASNDRPMMSNELVRMGKEPRKSSLYLCAASSRF